MPGATDTTGRLRPFAERFMSAAASDLHGLEHWKRVGAVGAQLAAEMRRQGLLRLDDDQFGLLSEACVGHTDGLTTFDPTIGCCWDADRLDLPRVGITPTAEYLSTEAARRRISA
jgi:hypothetical protein